MFRICAVLMLSIFIPLCADTRVRCMRMHNSFYVYVCTFVPVCTNLHACIYKHIYTYTCIRAYIHICVYMYIYV